MTYSRFLIDGIVVARKLAITKKSQYSWQVKIANLYGWDLLKALNGYEVRTTKIF